MSNLQKQIPLYLLLITAIICSNCSSGKRTVSINSSRPADITVNQSIKKIVILNRTKFSKNILNTLEGIVTGELPQEDKAGVQSFIAGLNSELGNSDRYIVRVANEWHIGNSLTQALPDPLDWITVENYCRKYSADAVLAIEVFDSDFVITEGTRNKTVKNDDGESIEVPEFYASGLANLTIGLRFYDVKSRALVDQQVYNRSNTWEGVADSKAAALTALITKDRATRDISRSLGSGYAYHIAPMPLQLTRSFTGKSKKAPALEQGSRYADVGKWDEAINAWKTGLNGAPTKQAGQLSLNIAIGFEVLGNLKEAELWAQKSYTQYGNKTARRYYNDLHQRIENESLVDYQLGN